MPDTFDEVMNFHPGNPDVYEEIRDNLSQLIPFVGAGLTAPVYGEWGSVIDSLGEIIASSETRKELKARFKVDPLSAAQFLEDQLGEVGLRARLVHHFSRNKLDAKWDSIKGGAIWLMPVLFPRPVLTTNFDQALERVYNAYGFTDFEVLDPTSHDLRQQATRFLNEPCVFKLHGTVAGRMLDYSKLVFTQSQYDAHYAPNSPVRLALQHFIRARAVIFLGCSLTNDRTVRILQEESEPGIVHFAIVNSEHKARDYRVQELARSSIRAIIYADKKHESVRAVLQHLFNDTARI